MDGPPQQENSGKKIGETDEEESVLSNVDSHKNNLDLSEYCISSDADTEEMVEDSVMRTHPKLEDLAENKRLLEEDEEGPLSKKLKTEASGDGLEQVVTSGQAPGDAAREEAPVAAAAPEGAVVGATLKVSEPPLTASPAPAPAPAPARAAAPTAASASASPLAPPPPPASTSAPAPAPMPAPVPAPAPAPETETEIPAAEGDDEGDLDEDVEEEVEESSEPKGEEIKGADADQDMDLDAEEEIEEEVEEEDDSKHHEDSKPFSAMPSPIEVEQQRQTALQEITEIEHKFAELRQRLFENRMLRLKTELQMCLEGSHPRLQTYYQKIASIRDYKLRRAYQRQKCNMQCIDTETRATRTHIHQDFLRKVSDLRSKLLTETTQTWYDINKERREMDIVVPEVNYHVPVKIAGKTLSCITGYAGPAQRRYPGEPLPEDLECENITFRYRSNAVDKLEVIVDRMRLNNELSDLEGLKRFFEAFPGAPHLSGLRDSEIYEDLQQLQQQSQPPK